MRDAVLIAFAALMSAVAPSHGQQPADLSGVWLREDGNARVRIVPCGNDMCATNLWIRDSSKGEEAGDLLVMSLHAKTRDTLSGTAYDRKRDLTYSITVRVSGNSLFTRGCILGGVLCKNVRWRPARR